MDVDVKKFLKIKFFFFLLFKNMLNWESEFTKDHERCKTKLTDESEHINLFKIIRWTYIPSNFRQYLIDISLLKNIYKLVSLPFASDKNLKELQQVINVK